MRFPTLLLVTLAAAAAPAVQAQLTFTATSPITGFNMVSCPKNSDTIVSAPLFADGGQGFKLASTGANAGTNPKRVLLAPVTTTPLWTDGELVGSHYVNMRDGAMVGRNFPVTANTDATITVEVPDSVNASDFAAGNAARLTRYHTLASLFPPAGNPTVLPSASRLAFDRKT